MYMNQSLCGSASANICLVKMGTEVESTSLVFFVNGRKIIERNADPELKLLSYLRRKCILVSVQLRYLYEAQGRIYREADKAADFRRVAEAPPRLQYTYLLGLLRCAPKGTKYGCGEGGCGSCTVMVSNIHPVSKKIQHVSANACLLPLCFLHGAAVTTVEGIGSTTTRLHPVQERIAKAHGSQCGFCTPGMVMSMYTLLRNNPDPSMDQIYEALGGNLCRCTGYRPIVDGYKTFSKELNCCRDQEKICNGTLDDRHLENEISTSLFNKEEFLPLDPSQDIIFPPELILMNEHQKPKTLVFKGERMKCITPFTLEELLKLKVQYPNAPLVVGNTAIGLHMTHIDVFHPVMISIGRIKDLLVVDYTNDGLLVGAACSLTMLKKTLDDAVSQLPKEKTKLFQALLQQLKTLAGQQIRNMASLGGHIIIRSTNSDLNPVLAAGNATLQLVSKGGTRHIPFSDSFFDSTEKSPCILPDEVLVSILIPYSQKWEHVGAFRQSQRKVNSAPIVVAGMRILFQENTDIIKDCNIFFGGIKETIVCAKKTREGLIGRHWDEEMLSEACRLILNEVSIPPSAPGGMVEYRRSLSISFFFKFFLAVLHELKSACNIRNSCSPSLDASVKKVQRAIPNASHRYQTVKATQPLQDTIGRPVVHHTAKVQASGEAMYCDDMPTNEEELFMGLITSTKAHARIISIDLTEALSMPGVCDVVTAKDIGDKNNFLFYDWPDQLLADDKVFCVGYIIGAVLADTPARAKQAAAKVKIVYEAIEPTILTIEDAISHNSFYEPDRKLQQGDVDEAFKTVDQIHEGEIHIRGQEHFYMETQSLRVVPSKDTNEMDIYVATQIPSYTQSLVASTLGLTSNQINVHVKRIGGAFGGKIVKTASLAAITAVAARKTKRTVRCVLERSEDMLITGGRHPYFGKYKVGFMNDGRIVAADIILYSNGGCSATESIFIMEVSVLQIDNAYNIPNLRCYGRVCKTNLPSNVSFRGFGFPQGALITEQWIEEVASNCQIPPHKIREINMYQNLSVAPYKQVFDASALTKCWDECMKFSAYHDRREAAVHFNKQNKWTKRGISIIPLKFPVSYITSHENQAAALVNIYSDGSVLLSHGGTEMGQGIHTKMIQIASRELGIPISYIHISETSTAIVPNTIATAASVGTDVNGMAVKDACEKLRKRLEPIISSNPTGTWESWINEAFMQKNSLSATGFFSGSDTYMNWEKGEGYLFNYCVYGVACSEVEIDCLTGGHKIIRTDIVMDVGCSINPAVDVGQIEGAFIQGIGLFTTEELKYSPEGILYTRGPGHYKIPSVYDIPQELNISLLSSSSDTYAIYSSKGLGEPGIFLGSSVYFAIKDAITSARRERRLPVIFTLNSPATAEKIRMACHDQFTDMIPKDNPGSFIPWAIDI